MRITSILAAAAVVFSAAPAAAAVTTIVLTGVASGSDNGHLTAPAPFGTLQLGVDLSTGATTGVVSERAFTLTLTIDDSRGAIDSFPGGDQIYGSGDQSPMTANFSMGGFAYDLGNLDSTFAKAFSGPDQIYGLATESRQRPSMTGDFRNVAGTLDFNIIAAGDLFLLRPFGEPVTWTRGIGDTATGHLALSIQDTSGTPLAYVLGPIRTADLALHFDTLTIAAAPTAVPEPGTWALLIAGFGLAGGMLRRRAIRRPSSGSSATLRA